MTMEQQSLPAVCDEVDGHKDREREHFKERLDTEAAEHLSTLLEYTIEKYTHVQRWQKARW